MKNKNWTIIGLAVLAILLVFGLFFRPVIVEEAGPKISTATAAISVGAPSREQVLDAYREVIEEAEGSETS